MFVRKGSSVLAPLILTLSVVYLLSRNCIIRFSSSVTIFVNNCSSCFLSIVSNAADISIPVMSISMSA